MATLNPLELERLKLLLSGKVLTIDEQISTLNTLRSKFPNFFSNLEPNLTEANLKDNNFLIKYLTNSYNRNKIKNALHKALSLSAAQQTELVEALEEPAATGEVSGPEAATESSTGQETQPPAGASSSGAGRPFGIPVGGGSYRPAGRVVYNVPHTPEPESKLALANKSGKVVAEATITPSHTTIESTTPKTSTLYTTNSSGAITGERTISSSPALPNPKPEAPQPKLVLANSSGTIKGTPTTEIHLANKSGTVTGTHPIPSSSRFNFSAFRSKVGGKITNTARIGLEKANPFLKRAGNGLVNSLTSIANPGGIGGTGSSSIFGRFSRFGRGGVRAVSSAGKTAKKSKGLLALMSVVGFMMLVGAIAISGTPSTGEAAPIIPGATIGGASGLDYTLPLKDPSIQPIDIRNQITAQFPNAQINNWQTITDQAKIHGFNPAFVLALWIEESGAQGASSYTDPLGCGVATPTTDINVSLNCLFKFDSQHNFTNNQFTDFMIIYAGGTPGQSLAGNDNFPKFPNVIKEWYAKMVPSGPGALTAIPVIDRVKAAFNLDVSKLPAPYPQWAYDVLSASTAKFQNLIRSKPSTVVPVSSGSHTSNDVISIRTGYDQDFFKQIFIHELGHRIKGTAGTASPQCNGQTLEQIEAEGYLTYYAEHATPANVKEPACGDNDQTTQSDEDFAESVSYYINNTMRELNYGSGCSTYNQASKLPDSTNPYNRTTEPRPAHRAYMQCLLGL